jgi:hypothetical protein
MANADQKQPRKLDLWHGRSVITLNEQFGRERLLQCIVVAPRGMSHIDALQRMDELFREAVEADPEEWTYEDVLQRLVAAGFEEIVAADWWEGHVEMNSD